MQQTPNLNLPYIMPSQAQKHVTHNEAIRMLDALVHGSVLDRHLTVPPATPADGDRYIVAAGATGEWAGHDGKLAAFQDGAWALFEPQAGWIAWAINEDMPLVYSGTAWVGVGERLGAIQNLSLLGLGATADAANPFTARLNKALWTARNVAEGGTGDLCCTMNKEAAADDVGLLLQTGFVTKALMGLFGSDDWRLSVSDDGSTFADSIRANRATGIVAYPSNPKFLGYINYDQYVAADTWTKVAINNTHYNDQGGFDAGSSLFTAPASGLYAVGATIGWKQNGTNVPVVTKVKLVKNGSTDLGAPLVSRPLAGIAADGSEAVLHLNLIVGLAANDTVELRQLFAALDGYVPASTTTFWGAWVG